MSKKTTSVAVSGYFDPIHVGHLEYLEFAKKLGNKLIVIVNNNHQCVLKKGKPFMDELDRFARSIISGSFNKFFLQAFANFVSSYWKSHMSTS